MNTRVWYIVIIVALIVILGAIYLSSKPGGDSASLSPSPSVSVTPGATITPRASSVPATATPVLNYSDAVKAYANTRIQFDTTCQARPNHPVFKNGVTIMLDNRSATARTIKIDTRVYNVPAFGFWLTKLSYGNSSLPHTAVIDCGSFQNVGKITIEK